MKHKMNKPPKQLINRLNRAEGQIRGLKRMLEDTDVCDIKNVVTQIKATRSALKAVSEEVIIHFIQSCKKLPEKKREKQVSDAIKLLLRD